ncbi:MAG: helix-turn-helix domain-containing protein, partial [Devosia sp.]
MQFRIAAPKGFTMTTTAQLTMTVSEVSKATGLSVAWLNQLRSEKRGPAFLKVGHRCLYRPGDVAAWL